MHRFIYLASQSPRRRQLLEQIGVPYRLLLPDAQENVEGLEIERTGELPRDYVLRVARLKLQAARARLRRRRLPPAPILSADTTVVLGRRFLGKPADAAHAREMLHRLAGRTHRVMTAVAVSHDAMTLTALSITKVRFTELSLVSIDRYVDSGEPMGKAGAYAIQSAAGAWVSRLDGSYSGVMGLPLHETAELLRQARVFF